MIFKLSFIESGEAQTAPTIFSFNLQVFKTSASSKPDKAKDVAESILSYFPGFDACKLPPPSSDPEVVLNLNRDEVQQDINKSFVRGVEEFKANLKSKLAPKLSFSEGEIVTGEGMWRGGGGGGGVSKEIVQVQFACQYDVTSRVGDFQNGEQSVHRRDG